MKRNLYRAVAIGFMLSLWPTPWWPAYADDQDMHAVEKGQHGFVGLMCHDPDAIGGLAIVIDSGQVDGDTVKEAIDQLLLDGICVYFPQGAGFSAIERVEKAGTDTHTVWRVKPDGNDGSDGKTQWFVLMKEGRPA
jgi:hypothetical protein